MKDNKAKRKPLISILLFMGLGAITGILFSEINSRLNILSAIDYFENGLYQIHTLLLFITAIVSIFVPYIFFIMGKNKVEDSLKNDDDILGERYVDLSLMLADLGLFFVVIVAALGFSKYDFSNYKQPLLDIVVIIVSALILGLLQDKIVEFIKTYNPKKTGNLFTLRFQQDWMKSSDEREKLEVYKAAYSSYRVTQNVLLFGVVILGVLSMEGIGFIPALSLGIVLLISKISYGIASIKNK